MAIRDWLAVFSNDVVEVKEPVATDLEATRILLRHPRQPVHLRNLHGGEAVGNLWSTRERVATSLRLSNADLLPRVMEAQTRPQAAKVGGELRVAVCIGLDPWNLLAGGTSVEYGVDESRIASALTQSCLGKPVDMVRIKNGLTVPAEAEYVLEGRLIQEVHEEGPFVD